MNNSLSFLDINIVRDNNKFTTSVYRKPIFSDVLTNFESFIPNSYKYALIFTCYIELSNYALILNYFTKKLKI